MTSVGAGLQTRPGGKEIMANEATAGRQKQILSNQRRILANQQLIKTNQRKLDALLSNQKKLDKILKNQAQIVANQKKILARVR
jgi:hypothetical protein